MTFDEIGQCWVAEADESMEGWTVLHREPFKDGVDRVHVRAVATLPAQFRIVYQRTANAELSGGEAVRSDDLLGEPMVHYAHKQDPQGVRFRQYAKDKIPLWAVDVQPCTPNNTICVKQPNKETK